MSEVLVELVGVCCPQGSELWGEDSVFVSGVVTCCGEIGANVEVGLGTKVDVVGKEFVCRGYIPGRQSCLLIRSASPVILSMMVLVSYNSGNSLMSSYAVRSLMTGMFSSVL